MPAAVVPAFWLRGTLRSTTLLTQLCASNTRTGISHAAACAVPWGLPRPAPGGTAGTIPAEWLKLPSLEYVYVKPGNLKLCGPLPEGMTFKVRLSC